MFQRLLIANRGEIACRIAQTAHRLGVRPIAVYSRSDAQAMHVRRCAEAFALTGTDERAAYLDGAQIIDIALACGAQAIHPGYGFLSENAEFAQACLHAGLVFVGPPPAAIRAMGLKAESKRRMAAAGVPILPGYQDPNQDTATLTEQAQQIGYPLLIKASAGGGGKGMRIVRTADEFAPLLAGCQREALASFKDAAVILERYVEPARHIEVQVFGDTHGQLIYLGDRDCSVQRRHQKIVEEAPAPGLDPGTRVAMGEAAVAAARAVDYVGAGTVEFIVDPNGTFYFMEMNTRLQVEHPVTEMVTGLDLVEWQLRVACGEPLPLTQDKVHLHGAAIEARLYAEQPERDFLPSSGVLHHLAWPAGVSFTPGLGADGQPAAVRMDAGVQVGDTLGTQFDPMLAKLIVWGANRRQALARMAAALSACEIIGPATNRNFLGRLLRCAPFQAGQLDTGLIAREAVALAPPTAVPASVLAAATLAQLQPARPAALDPDPWDIADSFRPAAPCHLTLRWREQDQMLTVPVRITPQHITLDHDGAPYVLQGWQRQGAHWRAQCNGQMLSARVHTDPSGRLHVFELEHHWVLEPVSAHRAAPDAPDHAATLCAPMPGTIIHLPVKVGDRVSAGQALIVMEAMKMEHTLYAPHAGTIAALPHALHDTVSEGATLVQLAAPTANEAPDA